MEYFLPFLPMSRSCYASHLRRPLVKLIHSRLPATPSKNFFGAVFLSPLYFSGFYDLYSFLLGIIAMPACQIVPVTKPLLVSPSPISSNIIRGLIYRPWRHCSWVYRNYHLALHRNSSPSAHWDSRRGKNLRP